MTKIDSFYNIVINQLNIAVETGCLLRFGDRMRRMAAMMWNLEQCVDVKAGQIRFHGADQPLDIMWYSSPSEGLCVYSPFTAMRPSGEPSVQTIFATWFRPDHDRLEQLAELIVNQFQSLVLPNEDRSRHAA